MAAYVKQLLSLIWANPTHAPDGKTDAQAAAKTKVDQTSFLHDITRLKAKDLPTVLQGLTTIASGEPIDDKDLLLEHGISLLQSLPTNSGLSHSVGNSLINLLWRDLPHPPGTLAGPDTKYRRHDGSGNSIWSPDMGKAGSPYSRSVPAMQPKGPNLPDPELVFEHLLKRKGPFRPHPSGLNRLFFSFATIVIHECFQTSRQNQWINETTSYLDLSTLYGNTEKEQKRVRTYNKGLIYLDSIASERIMLMPPGVIAVLLLFSRNHNHIAENLLSINEAGKYGEWDTLSAEQKKWQDEDIFQIARNINVGFFVMVVLRDYVAAILNTPRANSEWSLDFNAEIKLAGSRVERGVGNVVSVEFAVLYHWHAALSAGDANWMEDLIRENLTELKSLDDMTPEMFWKVVKQEGHKLMSTEPRLWTFGGISRGGDGRFSDADLGKIIKDCIEEPAHAFGAHGCPASMKVIEVMGMLQAREVFNVCTLNEFRKYLNLKPYETFEDWAEDEDTARAAELLYGHIDNLELYPGLQAECTKPAMPGSGVSPSHTTGRGILDDAVALVRGDRFLTYDFNSSTLTHWGVSKLSETAPGAYGGMLPKMLFNALPGEFTGTSTYALLPFYTPQAAKGILKGNKVIEKYDLKRPASGVVTIVGIHTQEGLKTVTQDRDTFRTIYDSAIRTIANNHGFLLGWDEQKRHDERHAILHRAFFEDDFDANITRFFRERTRTLIANSSLHYADSRRSIDIVRDVTNVVPVLWAAERFAIPLKTADHPRGLISLAQLFDIYLVLFVSQTFNILPQNEWKLREAAQTVAPLLRSIFETHLRTQAGGPQEAVVDWLAKGSAFEVGPDADRLYHALRASDLPIGDLAADCIGLGTPIVGTITQQASLLIDLYLSEGYETYKDRIVELARQDRQDNTLSQDAAASAAAAAAADRELLGFVYEGMRHAGFMPGLPRMAARDVTVQDGARGPVHIKAHQIVLVANSKAAMDPVAFPDPQRLDPTRPLSAYTLFGHGMHKCFGERMTGKALVAILREVFKLPNLRRADGRAGRFSIVEHEVAGVKLRAYLDGNSKESVVPTSLRLIYDDE